LYSIEFIKQQGEKVKEVAGESVFFFRLEGRKSGSKMKRLTLGEKAL